MAFSTDYQHGKSRFPSRRFVKTAYLTRMCRNDLIKTFVILFNLLSYSEKLEPKQRETVIRKQVSYQVYIISETIYVYSNVLRKTVKDIARD